MSLSLPFWAQTLLSASEPVISILKSPVQEKGRYFFAAILFAIESACGFVLTFSVASSTIIASWGGGPVAFIPLLLFEVSIVIYEIIAFWMLKNSGGVGLWTVLKPLVLALTFILPVPLAFMLVIFLKRRSLEDMYSTDNSTVDNVTYIRIGVIIFLTVLGTILEFTVFRKRARPYTLVVATCILYTFLPLLATMIELFRTNMYIETPVIQLFLVLFPPTFSASLVRRKLDLKRMAFQTAHATDE